MMDGTWIEPEPRELGGAIIGDVIAQLFGPNGVGPSKYGERIASRRSDTPISWVSAERERELRRMPYEQYLSTAEWLQRATDIRWEAGRKCELCSSTEPPLDVHHLTYERRGNEWWSDLIAMCRKCHFASHRLAEGATRT